MGIPYCSCDDASATFRFVAASRVEWLGAGLGRQQRGWHPTSRDPFSSNRCPPVARRLIAQGAPNSAPVRHSLTYWSVYSKMSPTPAIHWGFPKGPAPATYRDGHPGGPRKNSTHPTQPYGPATQPDIFGYTDHFGTSDAARVNVDRLSMSNSGNAFFNSATPASLTFVPLKPELQRSA